MFIRLLARSSNQGIVRSSLPSGTKMVGAIQASAVFTPALSSTYSTKPTDDKPSQEAAQSSSSLRSSSQSEVAIRQQLNSGKTRTIDDATDELFQEVMKYLADRMPNYLAHKSLCYLKGKFEPKIKFIIGALFAFHATADRKIDATTYDYIKKHGLAIFLVCALMVLYYEEHVRIKHKIANLEKEIIGIDKEATKIEEEIHDKERDLIFIRDQAVVLSKTLDKKFVNKKACERIIAALKNALASDVTTENTDLLTQALNYCHAVMMGEKSAFHILEEFIINGDKNESKIATKILREFKNNSASSQDALSLLSKKETKVEKKISELQSALEEKGKEAKKIAESLGSKEKKIESLKENLVNINSNIEHSYAYGKFFLMFKPVESGTMAIESLDERPAGPDNSSSI